VSRRFEGKVALVVGAGSSEGADLEAPGVGAAISLLFAREGAKIGVLGLGAEGAARTVGLIEAEGGEAIAVQADVSRAEDCRQAVEAVVARFGRLDILVNNLGIRLSGFGVVDVPEDEWDRVMDVNVKGPMLMAKYAAPHLPVGGSIVNISAEIAVRPTYTSSLAYATSQGALNTLTISLALQLAVRGIRVNGVSPGNLWTPLAIRERVARGEGSELEAEREKRRLLSPLGLEGTGWDVAYTAAFLASEEARWMTGQTLTLDGGAMLPAPASVKRPS
jgi:NAD(P)-dependent dehydrogenase (short-subunit alcohol dehydrogenase family)